MSSILTAFLGSLEASASVLLTIFYGIVAGYLGLVSNKSTVEFSRLAVELFLPCLLFSDIGSALSLNNIGRFAPVFIWAFAYNIIAIILGSTATRIFKLPTWFTPIITFNNATSLPLLLLQSFAVSGALSSISAEDTSDAINRAKAYFLVNATISNTLTFSLGPRIMKPNDQEENRSESEEPSESHEVTERTPLVAKPRDSSWTQSTWHFIYQFWNAPFIAACIGVFVGLIPALHDLFFDEGGAFRAWLTVSLTDVGNLFASTQVIITGVKLHSTFAKMKQTEDSGSVPTFLTIFILITRFIIMPMISIPIIYFLAAKTHLLSNDPILWFCMMVMPVGPSAIRLISLADVSQVEEKEKMVVSKLLALSYIATPLFCFAAVASLKACEAALESRGGP